MVLRNTLFLLGALGLAACGSGGPVSGLGSMFDRDPAPAASVSTSNTIGGVSVDALRADLICPAAVVREGADTLRVYADGMDGFGDGVRYQASIGQTAIECIPLPGTLTFNIGIAGRALLGPQGNPATLDLPIRIEVVDNRTGEAVSSNVTIARAVIEPPEVSALFSIVDRTVVVPRPQTRGDYSVFVGFDPSS